MSSGAVLDVTVNTNAAATAVHNFTEILDEMAATGDSAAAAIDAAGRGIDDALGEVGKTGLDVSATLGDTLSVSAAGAASALDEAGQSAAQVEREVANAGKAAEDAAGSFATMGDYLSKINLAAAAASAALMGIGKKAIDAGASALNTGVQFRTIFAGVGDEAAAMARRLSEELGAGEGTIQGMMQRIGGLLQQRGVSNGDALRLSAEMTQLAINIQDFTGGAMQAEQVISTLTSALDGMYRSVKQLGIYIDDDKVNAYAKAHGILLKELSSAQKASIVLALAQQQLAGRFNTARTASEKYYINLRHMSEAIDDGMENIGIMLLDTLKIPQAFQMVADAINAANKSFAALSQGTKEMIATIGIVATAFVTFAASSSGLVPIAGMLGTAFTRLSAAITSAALPAAKATAAFMLLATAIRRNSDTINELIGNLVSSVGTGFSAIGEKVNWLREIFDLASDIIAAGIETIVGLGGMAVNALLGVFNTMKLGAQSVAAGILGIGKAFGWVVEKVTGDTSISDWADEMLREAGKDIDETLADYGKLGNNISNQFWATMEAVNKTIYKDNLKPLPNAKEAGEKTASAFGEGFRGVIDELFGKVLPNAVNAAVTKINAILGEQSLWDKFWGAMDAAYQQYIGRLRAGLEHDLRLLGKDGAEALALEVRLDIASDALEDALDKFQGPADDFALEMEKKLRLIEDATWLSYEDRLKMMIDEVDKMRQHVEQINQEATAAAQRVINDYNENSGLAQLFRENGLAQSLKGVDKALVDALLPEDAKQGIAYRLEEALEDILDSGLEGKELDEAINGVLSSTKRMLDGLKRQQDGMKWETKYADLALAGSAEAYKQILQMNSMSGREEANARNLEALKENSADQIDYLRQIKDRLGIGNNIKVTNVAI